MESQKYFEKALEICRDIGDSGGEMWLLNNLGEVYKTIEHEGKSFKTFTECIEIADKAGDLILKGTALNNLGKLLYSEQPDKALEYMEQALDINREISHSVGIAYTLRKIGNLNNSIGNLFRSNKEKG